MSEPQQPANRGSVDEAVVQGAGSAARPERLKVKVEKTTIDGARAYVVTPQEVSSRNANRVLIHMHGGCYVLNGGDAGLREAMLMAARTDVADQPFCGA